MRQEDRNFRERALVCLVRSIAVPDTPEEQVRQHLLSHLIGAFGCPRSLIGVEVSLKAVVPWYGHQMPSRRLDIVCFFHHQGLLRPLLIIECKAARPASKAISQLNGYNFFVQAPAIALAWPGIIHMVLHGKKLFEGPFAQMPTYQQLHDASLIT
jgi:hypothetical protein